MLTESETVTFTLAQTFKENSHSPLAAIDVVLTGTRTQDPPPRVTHGLLTVNVCMSAFLALACAASPAGDGILRVSRCLFTQATWHRSSEPQQGNSAEVQRT